MRVGLYFGSFNPVHNGHLIIANFLANNTNLDQIWFVISPRNPLKKNAFLLNENHRKHLVDLSIEGEPKLRTSNIEFKLPRPSYTVDTLSYLKEKYSSYTFSIILGGDSFSNIKNWKNYRTILEDNDIWIYNRPGFDIPVDLISGRVHILQAPLLEISSSMIRKMIKEKKSIRFLVPDIVKQEIENQQFYY